MSILIFGRWNLRCRQLLGKNCYQMLKLDIGPCRHWPCRPRPAAPVCWSPRPATRTFLLHDLPEDCCHQERCEEPRGEHSLPRRFCLQVPILWRDNEDQESKRLAHVKEPQRLEHKGDHFCDKIFSGINVWEIEINDKPIPGILY